MNALKNGLNRWGVTGKRAQSFRGFSRGFTLLEVMIAIAIFALIMVAIYSSWFAILRSSTVGGQAAQEAQRTRVSMRAMEEALGATALYAGNPGYYSFVADTSGNFPFLSFVSRLPPSFPGSGLFGGEVVRRVTFSVESGVAARNQLVLRQSPYLEPPDPSTPPYSIVLATNVSLFHIEFYDAAKADWFTEWTQTNSAPRMVRISLAFGANSLAPPPEETAVQTVYIMTQPVPKGLQSQLLRAVPVATQPGATLSPPPAQ